MTEITSTAAKSLTSVGHRLGLTAASYFATELSFLRTESLFWDTMPVLLSEAMLCHHLTVPTMKATDTLRYYF